MNDMSAIVNEMKRIIELENIEESFKKLMLSYIEEKKNSKFIFGNLVILHYNEFLQKEDTNIINITTIAAVVELLILSLDIIDDIQDNDTNYLWSKHPALSLNLALSMLFITIKTINENINEYRELAIEVISDFVLSSINGQSTDIMNEAKTEESYIGMAISKSGSLVALSCTLGVVLATGKFHRNIEKYGLIIGVIQQINNDLSDLLEWNNKNDLLNKKYSLPIIYLFELIS